ERTKNRRPHTIPLSGMALDVLRSIPRRPECDFVFGRQGLVTWSYCKRAFKDGLSEHWTLHDLRRTVATGLGELGVEPHYIEAILNHVSGHRDGVAGTYNRATYSAAMAQALARWSDHVRAIVTGSEPKVVPIRAA